MDYKEEKQYYKALDHLSEFYWSTRDGMMEIDDKMNATLGEVLDGQGYDEGTIEDIIDGMEHEENKEELFKKRLIQ